MAEELEAQKSEVTCPRPHCWQAVQTEVSRSPEPTVLTSTPSRSPFLPSAAFCHRVGYCKWIMDHCLLNSSWDAASVRRTSEVKIEIVNAFFLLSVDWEAGSGNDVCFASAWCYGVLVTKPWWVGVGGGGKGAECILPALMQGQLLAHRRNCFSFKENQSLALIPGLLLQQPCTGSSCPGTL